MEPVVSVQTALLRMQMPELSLRPGASVTARVASLGSEHGVLVLAGIPLTAQLPDGIESGATLRLRVEEVTPERVVLRLDPQPPAAPAAGPPPPPPRVHVGDPPRRQRGGDPDAAGVSLAFDSPALGRIDLRIDLATGSVQVGVQAPPGRAFELAEAGSERLRATLTDAVGRPAAVRVTPRREPLDLYA